MSPRNDDFLPALAGARLSSRTADFQRFSTLREAAGNLLTKASDRLSKGQEGAGAALVRRALDLPYDERDGVFPAALWLELSLTQQFVQQMEHSEEDHSGWIGRAEILLSETEGSVAATVAQALQALLDDYELPHTEERRVRRLIESGTGDHQALTYLEPTSDLTDVVLGVLRAQARQLQLFADALTDRIKALEVERESLQAQLRARQEGS